ncbi:MAG: MFS transporter [Methylobacterium sp.]|nr:MAG: MFS transporter [Methylobacterium sp.]
MTALAAAPPSPASARLSQIDAVPGIRLALLALAMGGFTIGTTEFAAMSLLPQLSAGLGVDEPTAGHAISAYALGVVVGAPTLAIMAARLPKRRVLIGLMILCAIGNLASAVAPSFGYLLAFRFLSGLPHGAYFGVGALVAASLVPRDRRTQAVGRMLLGLTAATIVGVPLANLISQWGGWRCGFAIVTALALTTALLIARFVPFRPGDPAASPLRELSALKSRQVWLTLGTGAPETMLPVALVLFGIGMTAGTVVCAWGADRALMPTAGLCLLFSTIVLALYAPAAHHLASMLIVVTLIGAGGGLGAVLQARLMDVAGNGQNLAAALNHSAFNTANALGPWLGGLAITAGYGWTSTGAVGVALGLGGLIVWAISYRLDRR